MSSPLLPPKTPAVLLVDDDSRNLRMLEAILRPVGVATVLATSGLEALGRATAEDFALIVLDVQMPGMDGFETAANLKEIPRARSTPILFLTATVTDGSTLKAYARGAVDYMTKPFDADVLRSKVAVFVELYSAKELVRWQAAMLGERERTDLLVREQVARADADKQVERLRLLADAGVAVAVSLERDVILQALACALTPRFGDFCTFDVLTPAGALELIAVAHIDPPGAALITELRTSHPPDRLASRGLFHALRTGEAVLYARDVDGAPAGPDAGELETLFRELRVTSAIVVPMRAHGEILGVMTVGIGGIGGIGERGTARAAYTTDDVRLADSIGVRAAVGLVNARLHGEARDAIRLRDDFLSVASHELRTPLTSLRLTIEGLQRAAQSDARVTSKLQTADRQIGRLTDLIGQLLDVSRLVGGRLRLDLEEIDLASLVREAVGRFHDQVARSGSTVDLRVPDGVVGRWDALRIEQVVTNLFANAIKYGEGKPVLVEVKATCEEVELTLQDHGIGINPVDQARIFDRFERAVSSRHYGGFGLGLWITRQIVETLGGSIRVESAPGQGSTFVVKLPRIVAPLAVSSRP